VPDIKAAFTLGVPVMAWRHFAVVVGLGEDVVRGLIDHGHLPTIKIGKYRFVNLLKLSYVCQGSNED
jgi:hypothetical protein